MSVNLSGAQLQQPDLVELIASALHDAALRPEHLQLEMTESVLMDDAPHAITILQTLKGLGVRLELTTSARGTRHSRICGAFRVDVLRSTSHSSADWEATTKLRPPPSPSSALPMRSASRRSPRESRRSCSVTA